MPNPPRPVEAKRRLGNPGKRALPKIASVSTIPAAHGVPEPLRELLVEGRRMWDRVWTGGAVWLSPASDIELVQLLCESVDERVALRQVVLAGVGEWRDRVALRSLDDQIKSHLSALGFTPIDRTKMGVAEVRQESKLEALRARAGKR